MTQHTEESLMTLADEWYEAGEFSERRENREFLQLAIREVLAERDELQRDRDCLRRLYDAEKPLHERRTMPSPAFPDDPEYQPPYMFQASFWTSGCRCVECHALHVGEQQYIRAEKAEAELSLLKDDNAKWKAEVVISDGSPRWSWLAPKARLPDGRNKLYAAPPSDDEAVRLLREAREAMNGPMGAWAGTCAWHGPLRVVSAAIDAYLAKVGK